MMTEEEYRFDPDDLPDTSDEESPIQFFGHIEHDASTGTLEFQHHEGLTLQLIDVTDWPSEDAILGARMGMDRSQTVGDMMQTSLEEKNGKYYVNNSLIVFVTDQFPSPQYNASKSPVRVFVGWMPQINAHEPTEELDADILDGVDPNTIPAIVTDPEDPQEYLEATFAANSPELAAKSSWEFVFVPFSNDHEIFNDMKEILEEDPGNFTFGSSQREAMIDGLIERYS